MSMNQIIHAAVRRDVARTEQALRALPEGDGARARQLQRAWRNLVRELTHHHEAEDELMWPFLQSRGFDADAAGGHGGGACRDEAGARRRRSRDRRGRRPTPTVAHAHGRGRRPCPRSSVVINDHLEHEETRRRAARRRSSRTTRSGRRWRRSSGRPASSTPGARWPGCRTGRGAGARGAAGEHPGAGRDGADEVFGPSLQARGRTGLALVAVGQLGERLQVEQLPARHHEVADRHRRRQPRCVRATTLRTSRVPRSPAGDGVRQVGAHDRRGELTPGSTATTRPCGAAEGAGERVAEAGSGTSRSSRGERRPRLSTRS